MSGKGASYFVWKTTTPLESRGSDTAGMGGDAGLPCHLIWLLGRDLGLATRCPVTRTLPIVGPRKVSPQTSEYTAKDRRLVGGKQLQIEE